MTLQNQDTAEQGEDGEKEDTGDAVPPVVGRKEPKKVGNASGTFECDGDDDDDDDDDDNRKCCDNGDSEDEKTLK